MFCPKCKYTTFDYFKKCPKCDYDWSEEKRQLGLEWIAEPEIVEEMIEPVDYEKSPKIQEDKAQGNVSSDVEYEPLSQEKGSDIEITPDESNEDTNPILEKTSSLSLNKEEDQEIELNKNFFIEMEQDKEPEITIQKQGEETSEPSIDKEIGHNSIETENKDIDSKESSEGLEQDIWDIEFEDLVIEEGEDKNKNNTNKEQIDILLFVEDEENKKKD